MAGGGGSEGHIRGAGAALTRAIAAAAAEEAAKQLDAEVNHALAEALRDFNAIDRDLIRERLDEIAEALTDIEFDALMYAGSVAKHTAVDGLSDADAVMVFDPASVRGTTPEEIRTGCAEILRECLDGRAIDDIRVGAMAITVVYRDGAEIQIIPAVRRAGDRVDVPDRTGEGWIPTRPRAFRERLTAANEQMSRRLVPCIKLVKSIIDGLPAQQRISGYHIEALAVEAAASFPADRPKTLKEVTLHVLSAASDRVRSPIPDVTGQSTSVDQDLGAAGSNARRIISQGLQDLHRRLSNANDLRVWEQALGGGP